MSWGEVIKFFLRHRWAKVFSSLFFNPICFSSSKSSDNAASCPSLKRSMPGEEKMWQEKIEASFTLFQLTVHHLLWQIEKMLILSLHHRTDRVSSCQGDTRDIPMTNIACSLETCNKNYGAFLWWYRGQQPRRMQRREKSRRRRKPPWNQTCQIVKTQPIEN